MNFTANLNLKSVEKTCLFVAYVIPFFPYRFYFNCSTKFQNKGDKVKDLYQSIIYKANCFIYVKGKHLREYFQSVFSEPILHST